MALIFGIWGLVEKIEKLEGFSDKKVSNFSIFQTTCYMYIKNTLAINPMNSSQRYLAYS